MEMKPGNKRGFASDNNAGVHPKILEAVVQANQGHVVAYGDDPHTESATRKFKEIFGEDTEVFFVYNGTGANVLSIQALTDSFQAVICAETAHINEDECGAPEKFTGCKLLPISTGNGKITVDQIGLHLHALGNEHHAQPRVISLTQATELGTVYRPQETEEITRFAHQNGLFVHLDGARIANAAVSLKTGLREITRDVGIDVLSFGGTKNGIMFGEAVVFFNRALARDFKFIRKQGAQLASKMRFIAVQFEALLTDDLWRRNAQLANNMAALLEREVRSIPHLTITQPVDANAVFAAIPPRHIQPLTQEYFFYVWDEEQSIVRWMTSFDTTQEDIMGFVALLRRVLA
jgi:threonine aldolase